MPTFSRVRRKRGPALNWAPTQDSYYEFAQMLRSEGRLPLYLTQAAILQFEAHLRESSLPLPFGLLAGHVCICPDTKLEYLLIDTVARARIELSENDPYAQLAEELQSLVSEQASHGKLAAGWYLGGLADDLTLDDDVTRLHGRLFSERWQVALVRGAESGVERGAFLRYESIWSRWYSIPFQEFLSERAGHKKGELRTAIRWTNYRSDEPARPLDELEVNARRADAAPRPSWGARVFGGSAEPFLQAGRSTPGRGTPARAPARADAKDTPARRESPSAPPPQAVPAATAPRPTVMVPPSRSEPLEIAPPPRRAPDAPRIEPAERRVAVHVDRPVTVPIAQEPTAPVDQKLATPVERSVAAPLEQKATLVERTVAAPVEETRPARVADKVSTPTQLRVAPTPELKVASAAALAAPMRAEARVVAPADVQQVFIDGGLVPAPLAYEFPQKQGMLSGPERVRTLSIVLGALLLLILVLLYLVAR